MTRVRIFFRDKLFIPNSGKNRKLILKVQRNQVSNEKEKKLGDLTLNQSASVIEKRDFDSHNRKLNRLYLTKTISRKETVSTISVSIQNGFVICSVRCANHLWLMCKYKKQHSVCVSSTYFDAMSLNIVFFALIWHSQLLRASKSLY